MYTDFLTHRVYFFLHFWLAGMNNLKLHLYDIQISSFTPSLAFFLHLFTQQ